MGKSNKKTRRPYGSGTIRDLGNGKWEIQATCGRRADGGKRRAKRVVHGTKADAELSLLRLRTEMGARPNMGDSMTLDEYYWGVYVPVRGSLLSGRTLETYSSVYRTHIAPMFGSWPADHIGRSDVQRWIAMLPSAATAKKAHTTLRLILRAMYDDELLDERPLDRHVRLPRHQVAPKGVWTVAELMTALERLRGHQLEGIVLAIAGGGLRREEALALDLPQDLHFASVTGMDGRDRTVCRLVVSKAWTVGEEQRDYTKTYLVRPVTIGEPFASRLEQVVSDGRPKLLMGKRSGRPLRPASVCETWSRAFRKPDGGKEGGPLHGLPYVELKSLRSLHVTMVARGGMDSSVNADLHGHSRDVMRSNYLALAQEDADRMAEAVAAQLASGTSRALFEVTRGHKGPQRALSG